MQVNASTLLLILVGGGVVYLMMTRGILSPTPQKVTASNTQGKQSQVPGDDFQAATSAIASIFQNASKLFGGSSAQTSPNSL